MGTPPKAPLIMYYILVFTKDLQLSCECKVYFIFMTCEKLYDRPPLKIGAGNSSAEKNPTIKQGTHFISR